MVMNIDERLDRLTERHEALSQSLEMLVISTRDNGDQIRALGQNSKRLEDDIIKLVEVSNRDADAIRSLAGIAESHERRLMHLEEPLN